MKAITVPLLTSKETSPERKNEYLKDVFMKKTRISEKDTNIGSRYNESESGFDSQSYLSEVSLAENIQNEYSTLSAMSISEVSGSEVSFQKSSNESKKKKVKKQIRGAILSKVKEKIICRSQKHLWDT